MICIHPNRIFCRVNLALGGVNLGQIYVNLEITGICESGLRIIYQQVIGHFQIPRKSARKSVNLRNTPAISGCYSRFTDSQNPTLPTGERDALRRSLLQRSREFARGHDPRCSKSVPVFQFSTDRRCKR